jgi:hypothetical protein
VPDPKNPGDRTKAHRFRRALKAGQTLQPVDQLWFEEYEEKASAGRQQQAAITGAVDVGASRKTRTISLDIDEQAESVGTGSAAIAAASAALVAKEEGRRLDALLINAVDAMKMSADINRQTALMLREDYGALFELLSRRTEILESTHIEMLQAVHGYYRHAMEAEGALVAKESEGDPSTAMLIQLLSQHLGVQIPAGALPPSKKRLPPNGVKQ